MVRKPSMPREDRWKRRAGGLALALAIASGTPARGQSGLNSGGPTGLGGGVAGPRGSAVMGSGSSSSGGDPDRFGGLEGGEGRKSGSVGAASRGLSRTSPGDPDESLLGPPLGSSGTVSGENVPGNRGPGLLGGRLGRMANPSVRPGSSSSRDPNQAVRDRLARDRREIEPPEADDFTRARKPGLEAVGLPEDEGPEDGLTLDAAIETLLRQNLDLMAQRFEIPKARADVLTAGLRDNPIFYADAQLVPYGNFTRERPGGGGGQPQYDVNVSLPLDVNNKRKGRVAVARLALKVTEAQFQDAARNLIDDLYRAFVNVLAARETQRFGAAYLARIGKDRADAEAVEREKAGDPMATEEERKAAADAVLEIRARERQSILQVRQAGRQLERSANTLAQLIGIPPHQADALRIRARLREPVPTPLPGDDLVMRALACRPDLAAYRLGTSRADADVKLARANRYSDVYLVYQPYTFQSNHSFGAKGTYTYGVGINAALPLFNRNQGNIARAESNAAQTRVELAALEQAATYEIRRTVRDIERTHADVLELENEVIPAAVRSRDAAYDQYREDPAKVGDYVDEQEDLNEVIHQYRDTLIDLRQTMLDLNTAVGQRVLP
ncbi:TolC family protein [Tundrisphaera sp. TA3]|uniref:TolC family protein n=1 Tax=Tundrisphaera sp. TA3 TaxID=3435775 RepID=UPI003EBEBC9E